MRFLSITLAAMAVTVLAADDLKIEKTAEVENCSRKTQRGDKVDVHYRGMLQKDGSEFDASYKRGQPLTFVVGKGSVIKGWDEGLLDMCIGEKRTLTIPPELGYGSRGMGPIPANSVLIFETELMGIGGVEKPKEIKYLTKAASSAAAAATDAAGEVVDKVEESVAEKIMEKVGEAASVLNTIISDTDEDGQEHNEL